MYYDILASINVYRPGEMSDPKKRFEIENLADQSVTLADLKRILEKRLDGSIAPQYLIDDAHLGKDFWNKGQPTEQAKTRDAIEKRKHIGFILFTLGQTHKPLLNTPLFDKGVERAQVISGLYDFTNASIEYVWTMARLEERVAQTIKTDRDGWMTLDKKRTPGYIDKIEQEIDNLVKIQQRIDIADKRLADVKKQRDQFNKIYEDRAMQYKEAVDRLLKERTKTENYAKQLRVLQDQLLNSLLELADAGERNYQIEAEIRAIELEYIRRMQSKGATKP
jgi:hypothetical protein